jgi:Ca2+-transporting ATPase
MNIKFPFKEAYTLSVEDVLKVFDTKGETGLSASEAEKRSETYGLNVYQTQKQKPVWLMLLQQFNSPIVFLLVFGAAVSIYFHDYVEAIHLMHLTPRAQSTFRVPAP